MMNKVKYRYFCYYSICFVISRLPFTILYALSDAMFVVLYYMVNYRKTIVRQNLRLAFPAETDSQLLKWEKKFYHSFCDNIVESIKLLHISDTEVAKRITVTNTSIVDEILCRNHPVIILLGHYANWEWVPYISKLFKNKTRSVQIYKPVKDRGFDLLMLKIRSRFHSESIPQHSAIRRLLSLKNQGTFVAGFVSDQRSNSKSTHHWVKFFGIETQFSPGGEVLGDKCNAEYLYLDIEKVERGRYTFTYKEIKPVTDTEDYPHTRMFYNLLEDTIRRDPSLWLWSHRRWLYSRDMYSK